MGVQSPSTLPTLYSLIDAELQERKSIQIDWMHPAKLVL